MAVSPAGLRLKYFFFYKATLCLVVHILSHFFLTTVKTGSHPKSTGWPANRNKGNKSQLRPDWKHIFRCVPFPSSFTNIGMSHHARHKHHTLRSQHEMEFVHQRQGPTGDPPSTLANVPNRVGSNAGMPVTAPTHPASDSTSPTRCRVN